MFSPTFLVLMLDSICCVHGGESDMRFIFTACAISKMLNDWSGIDTEKVFSYIISSQVIFLVVGFVT